MEEREAQLLEALDEGMKILGDHVAHLIYIYIERECGVKRGDIPSQPRFFSEGLRRLFGTGARTIEKQIVMSLCRRFGMEYDEELGLEFYFERLVISGKEVDLRR